MWCTYGDTEKMAPISIPSYPEIVIVWFWVLIKGSNELQCYVVMDSIKTFLVPYSYRATIKKTSDSISARGRDRENYWKQLKHFLSLFLSDNLAVVLYFLVLQDKHHIRKLSVSITVSCTRWETGQKSSPNARFSICFSKARTNKLYIFDNICIFILLSLVVKFEYKGPAHV
jgi:hypothetical protein